MLVAAATVLMHAFDPCAAAVELARTSLDDPSRFVLRASFASADIASDDECLPSVATALREAAFDHHRRAMKTRTETEYEHAVAFYDALLTLPALNDETRAAFFRAEALWELGRWRDAGVGYANVLARAPAGEYAAIAAYNRVLAWERAVNKARSPLAPPAETPEPSRLLACPPVRPPRYFEMTTEQTELVAAMVAYRSFMDARPRSSDDELQLAIVTYKHAYLALEHLRPEGEALLREVIARWPESKYASIAAERLIDFLAFERKDLDALELEVHRLNAHPVLRTDAKLRPVLDNARVYLSNARSQKRN